MSNRTISVKAFTGLNQFVRNYSVADDIDNFSIDEGGALYKRYGFESVVSSAQSIGTMWAGTINSTRILAYLTDNKLYLRSIATGITLCAGDVGSNKAAMFLFDGKLYILTSSDYYKYDGYNLSSVTGYIPLIAVSTTPAGAGTAFESVNMLTSSRRQQFSPDGSAAVFQLAEKSIASVTSVTENGNIIPASDYSVNTTNGTVTFNTIPVEGINSVEITYSAASNGRNIVTGCEKAMLFGSNADERVFLWKNTSFPCYRYHSELADGVPSAEYFPVTAYTVIGNMPITDIVQQYDKQLIFTTDSAYYSYCEMKTSVNGQTYASFPVYPLNPVKGNLIYGSGCTLNGMPVTLCRDGINIWQSTDVETEKNAECISLPVKGLVASAAWGSSSTALLYNAISCGELFFVNGNTVIIYNYRNKSWYVWKNISVTGIIEAFGQIYFSCTDKNIYILDSTNRAFSAKYAVPFSDFGSDSLKDIDGISLTIKAGYVTAGKVTVTWPGTADTYSVTKTFTIPATQAGKTVKISLPFYIPLITGASITFECESGKELNLLGYDIKITDKGGNYGL